MTKFETKVRDLINYQHSNSVGDLDTIVKEEAKILYDIAKNELVDKAAEFVTGMFEFFNEQGGHNFNTERIVKELKSAMKGE